MIRQWLAAVLAVLALLWALGVFDRRPDCVTDTECAERFGGDGGPGGFWRSLSERGQQ